MHPGHVTPELGRPLKSGPTHRADVALHRVVLTLVPVPAGPVRKGSLADGTPEPALRRVDQPVPFEVRALQEPAVADLADEAPLVRMVVRRGVCAEVVGAGELPAADGAGVARPRRVRVVGA